MTRDTPQDFDGEFATNGPRTPEAWVIVKQELKFDANGEITVADAPPRRFDKSFYTVKKASHTLAEMVDNTPGVHQHLLALPDAHGDDSHYVAFMVIEFAEDDDDHHHETAKPVAAVIIHQQGHKYHDILERINQRKLDENVINDLETQFSTST